MEFFKWRVAAWVNARLLRLLAEVPKRECTPVDRLRYRVLRGIRDGFKGLCVVPPPGDRAAKAKKRAR